MSGLKVIVPGTVIEIPDAELTLTYVRSSGPGGQNVNKVNSKAVLRWNAVQSESLPPFLRARILAKLAGKLTIEGDLLLVSDRFRDQIRNREDCLEKLAELLREASTMPKVRRKTRPSRSSQQKAAKSKQKHAQKKQQRRAKFDPP